MSWGNVDIITATVQDLDAVMVLVQSCIAQMRTQGIDQWDDVYPDRALFEGDVANRTLYLAVEQQVCRGIMVLDTHQLPPYTTVAWHYRDGPILVVHRLAIDPMWQGQGIASQLMDFAEAQGRARGARAIRLDAFSQNPSAVRLYTRRQYRLAGQIILRKGTFYCFEKLLERSSQGITS